MRIMGQTQYEVFAAIVAVFGFGLAIIAPDVELFVQPFVFVAYPVSFCALPATARYESFHRARMGFTLNSVHSIAVLPI
jgi:hypothetical protein